MINNNDKNKKGFSGLSDLASEVSGLDEPIKPEPKTEARPPTPKQPPQTEQRSVASEPEREATGSSPPMEIVSSGKSRGGLGGKWIFIVIGVAFMIWVVVFGGPDNNKPSYNTTSSPQNNSYLQGSSPSAVQTPNLSQSAELQYTEPPVGTDNVLSVSQIRWCIRGGIRIDAMRGVVDTNEGVNEFNRIVNDYNSRCGSFRYHEGSRSRAERDVESFRSRIVSEAVREARQLDSRSFPSVSSGASTSSAPKTPNAQNTIEAQQLLTDLGYDPGPVDGDYGRRTAEAVNTFQRDVGITPNGWIDEDLLSALRRAKAAYKPPVVSQPKPQTQTRVQPRSSAQSAGTTTTPENLSFEEQSRIGTANRLAQVGYNVDWRTTSLTDMLDAESRIGTANRLRRKGISVDWRNYSLTQLLKMEYGQD